MGYAFDPMQERWGAFKATLILGIIWSIWHVPFFIVMAENAAAAGLTFCLVGLRFLLVGIYNNTGKSVFAAILLHAMYNVSNSMFPNFNVPLGVVYTAGLLLVAAVLVVSFDKALKTSLAKVRGVP